MRPAMAYPSTQTLWADAVFASGLQRCDEPSAGQVRQSAVAAIRAFGSLGCAGRVAQEFGDHPETAVIRMRWAHAVTHEAFAVETPEPGPGADAHMLPIINLRNSVEQKSFSSSAGQVEPTSSAAGGYG